MNEAINTGIITIEKRTCYDRRKTSPPLFSRYLLTGQREKPRRKKDREKPQRVDRYSPRVLIFILVIIGLSMTDAFFTLHLISNGAQEVNPVMAYFLEKSPMAFILAKYVLTAASAILILLCKDYYLFKTKIRARVLFYLVPILFIFVIQWQLYLIFAST